MVETQGSIGLSCGDGTGGVSAHALANAPAMSGTSLTRPGLEDFTPGFGCRNSTVALAAETQALLGQGPSVTQFRARKVEKIITSHHAEVLQISNMKFLMALRLLFHS